jgi:DNA-directed RNA polymerase omega subunit
MPERRATLMEPRTESLLARVDSKFTLVTLAAMRAREINDYYNQLGEAKPPEEDAEAEAEAALLTDAEEPDQA